MGSVTACMMDVITEKSGHTMTGLAVSVCLTPAAPSPLPLPYPTVATVSEGVIDECLRTKIDGAKVLTVGSCTKNCHGNEPGTLKEVVSLNTAGPSFPIMGAPIVFIELGMAGITLSPGFMNKNPLPGIGGSASGAGGGVGGGGGAGGGAGGPPGSSTSGPSNGGGGGGGNSSAAAPPNAPAPPGADGQASGGHPIDVVTGTLYSNPATDFLLPGFLPVAWTRTYMTSGVRRDIGLGWGWSTSLHITAVRKGEQITLVDEAGRESDLLPLGDGEVALLPYHRSVRRVGSDLVVDLGGPVQHVLRWDEEVSQFQCAELRDKFGHTADIGWENGQIVSIVDSVGRIATRTIEGRVTSWTVVVKGHDGREHTQRLVAYERDDRGDLVQVIDAGGVVTRFAYDEEHYLIEEVRADGLVFAFRHETVRGKKLCVETWGYLPGRNILAEMSLDGAAPAGVKGVYHTTFRFEEDGETVLLDALGNRQRYAGNALGLVEKHVDPRGYTRSLSFDPNGRMVALREGGGGTARRVFDALGRLTSFTGYDGQTSTLRYDEAGNATRVDLPEGRFETKFEKGLPKEKKAPNGRVVTYEYDDHGRIKVATFSTGETEAFEYDAHGNILKFKGQAGDEWQYGWDLYGRPVHIVTPEGGVHELGYDSRGLLVWLTGPAGRIDYDNDGIGRVIAVRHTSGGMSRYRYVGDALVERTYPDGTRWRMGYDALNRLVAVESPLGDRHTLTLDAAGTVIGERTFAGLSFGYEIDGNGFCYRTLCADESVLTSRFTVDGDILTIVREHSGGTAEQLEYDKFGKLVRGRNSTGQIERYHDEAGRIVREVQTAGGYKFAVRYEYDERGALSARRYSTGWGVTMKRGAAKRLESLTAKSGDHETTLAFEYDAAGHEKKRAGGRIEIVSERDMLGRIAKISVGDGGDEPTHERRYQWSPEGPLSRVDDSRRGGRSYTLDSMGRPLRVAGLGATEQFTMSPIGTPMDRDAGLAPGGRPRTANGAALHWDRRGRLAAKASHDKLQSFQYHYDAHDRLITVLRGDGRRVDYRYDVLGRRVAETCDGITTWFGWDENACVEEQRTTGDLVRRVFGDDGYTPLLEARNTGAFRQIVADDAATPWLYLAPDGDVSEIDLTAFGKVAFQSGDPGTLRFAGQRADSLTGLHYNRHRYYDPDLCVFITPDPYGIGVTMLDVAFVPNVTLYMDPLGLWVAIIQAQSGEGLVNRTLAGGPAVVPSTRVYERGYASPTTQTFTHDQIDQAIANGQSPLAGATHVIVVSHGAPGSVSWGNDRPILGAPGISGQQLGQKLNSAGLNGPGAQVDVVSCNAGTKPFFGQSVAQGVATTTGATTTGAVANNRVLGYLGMGGTTRTHSGINGGPPGELIDRGTMGTFHP